jgi:hypothetical protein
VASWHAFRLAELGAASNTCEIVADPVLSVGQEIVGDPAENWGPVDFLVSASRPTRFVRFVEKRL